jgi:hypothetical protein
VLWSALKALSTPRLFAPFLRACRDDPREHAGLACGRSDGYAQKLYKLERPRSERARQESDSFPAPRSSCPGSRSPVDCVDNPQTRTLSENRKQEKGEHLSARRKSARYSIVKSPKLCIVNTGLLCALLSIRSEEALRQSPVAARYVRRSSSPSFGTANAAPAARAASYSGGIERAKWIS